MLQRLNSPSYMQVQRAYGGMLAPPPPFFLPQSAQRADATYDMQIHRYPNLCLTHKLNLFFPEKAAQPQHCVAITEDEYARLITPKDNTVPAFGTPTPDPALRLGFNNSLSHCKKEPLRKKHNTDDLA